jgi:hypothetical protein
MSSPVSGRTNPDNPFRLLTQTQTNSSHLRHHNNNSHPRSHHNPFLNNAHTPAHLPRMFLPLSSAKHLSFNPFRKLSVCGNGTLNRRHSQPPHNPLSLNDWQNEFRPAAQKSKSMLTVVIFFPKSLGLTLALWMFFPVPTNNIVTMAKPGIRN